MSFYGHYSFDAYGGPRKKRPPVPTFVGRPTTCKRCGAQGVLWAESKTKKTLSGSPALYLSESFTVVGKYGKVFTNYRPHFKTCAENQAENALAEFNGEDEPARPSRSSWRDDVANGRTDDAMHNYEMHLEMGVYGSDSDYSTNEDL